MTKKDVGRRLLRWLAMPPKECTLFFVMSIAAWLLLYGTTKWSTFGWLTWLPHLVGDVYVLCLLLCLLPRRWRRVALVLLYVVMYVSGFFESFLYQRYYMHVTPQALTMLRETTPTEADGFVRLCLESPVFWKTMFWWALLPLAQSVVLAVRRLLCRRLPMLRQRVQRVAQWVFLPLVAVCLLWWVPARVEMVRFLNIDRTAQTERVKYGLFYSTPWRLVYSLKFEQLAQRELGKLAHNMAHMNAEATDEGVPLIVLVIGESHNKHHSSVYGYGLETTPFQRQQEEAGNMVALQDAVTPWNVTSSVFKEILSTHSSDQEGLWSDGVLLPALMRKAGYRVGFLTNQFHKQRNQNQVNYNGSFFLNSLPFDTLCFDYRNGKRYGHDIGMLGELPDTLGKREFIILHLMGQHQPYADRVTKGGHIFTAQDIKRKDLDEKARRIVADYDNATLDNDKVLESVYKRYEGQKAVIIYVADHGEEVYDGNIGMFGRNHMAEPTPQIMWAEFEVPFEVFVTPAAQQAFPWIMPALQGAQDKPFGTDDLPHMVLRLGGVKTTYYNKERDILSPEFKVRERPVKDGVSTYERIMKRAAKTAK